MCVARRRDGAGGEQLLPVPREAPGGALRLLLWFLTQSCSLRAPVGVRTGSAAHGAPLAPPRLGGAPAGLQIPRCSSGCSCSRQGLAELCRKQEFLQETHSRRREGKAAAAGAPRGRGQREGTHGGGDGSFQPRLHSSALSGLNSSQRLGHRQMGCSGRCVVAAGTGTGSGKAPGSGLGAAGQLGTLGMLRFGF